MGTLTNGNYSITTRHDGTWVVSPKDITVTANGGGSVYGDTDLANPGFTAEGLANSETVAVLTGLENSFGIANTTGAGDYTLSVVGTLTNGNYRITTRHDGMWVVSPKDLVVAVNDAERAYEAPNPEFTARFEGWVNGDTAEVVEGLVFSTEATSGTPPGDYLVAASGGAAKNYMLHYLDGRLTIRQPGIVVDGATLPVVEVDQAPAISDEHAVVVRGGRRTLVPLINSDEGESRSVEDVVAVELATSRFESFAPPVPSTGMTYRGVFRPGDVFDAGMPAIVQTSYSEFLEAEEVQ